MLIICCDAEFRYVIEVADNCGVKLDHGGSDFVLVPDPDQPGIPFWLSDFILLEAARAGEFGLKLVAEEPL